MGSNRQDWSKYPVTVLLIDDQQSVCKAISKVLADVEYFDFHACSDPTQAIAEILRIGPTVILLDIHMPIMDGFDILKQLQDHDAIRDIPTVILTVDDNAKTKNRAFELNAIDYLIKVPDKTELVVRLRNHTRAYIDHLEQAATLTALREKEQKLNIVIKALELSSYEDALTQVPNRRSFDDAFHREWQRALRETMPLSVVLIDIDFFKLYNDFYGHLAGDDCLREVAQCLAQTLQRPTDSFARYGGEEFVAILPSTDATGAIKVAEMMRLAVVSLNLEHIQSTVGDCVTISLGIVTTIPMIKHHPRKFINSADSALYEAKEQGRNRVVCKSI
ncbi:MAG: diguanylate cyclase [Ghiorsea sp.]